VNKLIDPKYGGKVKLRNISTHDSYVLMTISPYDPETNSPSHPVRAVWYYNQSPKDYFDVRITNSQGEIHLYTIRKDDPITIEMAREIYKRFFHHGIFKWEAIVTPNEAPICA